jgi:hypothetical protein
MDHRETGWRYGLDSSGLGQRPVAGTCEHSNDSPGSKNAWNFLSCQATVGLSRRTWVH